MNLGSMEIRKSGTVAAEVIAGEFAAAQRGPVLVDHSMFGRVEISGADRLDLLHRLSSNDLAGAREGEIRSTLFLTDKGRIVDRVLVFVGRESLLLVTSPGADELLERWIDRYTITEDISIRKITDSTIMFLIAGHGVESGLPAAHGFPIEENMWAPLPAGGDGAMIALRAESRRRYAIAIAPRGNGGDVRDALVGAGCRPIGSISYEAYRINEGIAARPGELSEAHNPYETGVIEDVSFTKGCYIGQEVIARIDTYQKSKRRLTGLLFVDAPAVASGEPLLVGDREIGQVTSVMNIGVGGRYLGLGIVSNADAPPGALLETVDAGARARACDFPIVPAP